jgi:seryl-tRNA synthetase
LDFLEKRNFGLVQPPFFMNKDAMAKTAQLDEFDEALYKVIPLRVTRSAGLIAYVVCVRFPGMKTINI